MSTAPPHIPPRIATYIGDILRYNWADEEADYATNPDPDHPFTRIRAVSQWLTGILPTVPDIGDRFERDGDSYVVTGWLRRNPDPGPGTRCLGPDRCPLLFCGREDAEYVHARGVAGIIARVAEARVTGRADWHESLYAHERRTAEILDGHELH